MSWQRRPLRPLRITVRKVRDGGQRSGCISFKVDEASLFLATLDPEALEFTFQTFDDNQERAEAYKAAQKAKLAERHTTAAAIRRARGCSTAP